MDLMAMLPLSETDRQAVITSSPPSWIDDIDWYVKSQRAKADAYNSCHGNLTGIDCPVCLNRGDIMACNDEGDLSVKTCQCMAQRRSLRYMERSGLAQVLDLYTWDAWQEDEPWQKAYREMAQDYAQHPSGWFFAAGKPGTGKTHICTAICGDLLRQGKEVRYILWRDFSTQAKAVVNDDEAYRDLLDPVKRVPVLYLDDFLKTGKGQEPTTGDVNLAFELINARYADPTKLTIISSELPVAEIVDIDEAVGSRIYERSKAHYADLSGRQNWRMK